MTKSLDKVLAGAIRQMMRPLIRILLRNGYAYGSLAEQLRQVYVEVALEEFPPEGKKQTVSRVSALTGLNRKEVKRLLEGGDPERKSGQDRYNRAVRVISGWINDERFQNDRGRPAELPVEGGRRSFSQLVKDHSGDIPTVAMLDMLLDAGSVRRRDDTVRLIRHAYIPGGDSAEKIRILGNDAGELIATIDHNLTAGEDELLFQRKVAWDNIAPEAVPKLRKLSFRKAQSLLEQLNREYAKNEQEVGAETNGKYISLGIYFHEHDPSDE
jgi:hypothetical protein